MLFWKKVIGRKVARLNFWYQRVKIFRNSHDAEISSFICIPTFNIYTLIIDSKFPNFLVKYYLAYESYSNIFQEFHKYWEIYKMLVETASESNLGLSTENLAPSNPDERTAELLK